MGCPRLFTSLPPTLQASFQPVLPCQCALLNSSTESEPQLLAPQLHLSAPVDASFTPSSCVSSAVITACLQPSPPGSYPRSSPPELPWTDLDHIFLLISVLLHGSFPHTSKHHRILPGVLINPTHPSSKSTELNHFSTSEGNLLALSTLTACSAAPHTPLSHLCSSNRPPTQAVLSSHAHLRPFHIQPYLNPFDHPTLTP